MSGKDSKTIYIYDTLMKRGYQSELSLPEKRSDISGILVKDRIYIIGDSKDYWSLSIYGIFGAEFILRKEVFKTSQF